MAIGPVKSTCFWSPKPLPLMPGRIGRGLAFPRRGGWHRQNLNPTLFKSTSPCRAERSLLLPQAFPAEATSSWSPGDVQQRMGWLRLFVPARVLGRVRSPVLRGFPVVMEPPSVRGPPSEG